MSIILTNRIAIEFSSKAPFPGQEMDIIGVFHRWIQEQVIPETLLDVVDYSHVPGSGIILIGHEADYILNPSGNHTSFTYRQKRGHGSSLEEQLRNGWASALKARALLEDEEMLTLSFQKDRCRLQILDRLHFPNQEDSLDLLRPSIEAILSETHKHFTLKRAENDPREALCIDVSFP